jgi:hypothetical protein
MFSWITNNPAKYVLSSRLMLRSTYEIRLIEVSCGLCAIFLSTGNFYLTYFDPGERE